jgi:DNA-directed RNA polymerase specialized sigma subunit
VRIIEHAAGRNAPEVEAVVEGDWADRTRRVLTRDLLRRAHRARPTEGRALQFRALHLNLPLVGVIAEAVGLDRSERRPVEHAAMDGLVQALRVFDPYGDLDFTDFATPFVEREIRHSLRLRAGRA